MKLEVEVNKNGNIAEIRNFVECSSSSELHQEIRKEFMLKDIGIQDFYLTQNGKPFHFCTNFHPDVPIIAVSKLLGGKGGFGSMLRAIGAQIEKTTNRDACRDLSGRRLRDINEEQRLKRWFAKQAEREEEKKEAKKRKLEKLKQITEGPPLPKMDDQEYNKQRAEMADSVYAAVDYCFEETPCSSSTSKPSSSSSTSSDTDTETNESGKTNSLIPSSSKSSKSEEKLAPKPAKIKKLMMDDDLDSDCSSDSDVDEKAVVKA